MGIVVVCVIAKNPHLSPPYALFLMRLIKKKQRFFIRKAHRIEFCNFLRLKVVSSVNYNRLQEGLGLRCWSLISFHIYYHANFHKFMRF